MNKRAIAPVTASLDYQAFKKAIVNATKIIEKRGTTPVLSCILIKLDSDGNVTVSGTDLGIYTATFVPGTASRGFVAIMSAGTEFRETRKSVAFRGLMAGMNASYTDLPPGSFAEAGTYVNTLIVRVRKNGAKK